MSGLVAAVDNAVDPACLEDKQQLSKGSKDKKRSLALTGAPTPNRVIDFDKQKSPLSGSDKKPDYLFVSDDNGRGGASDKPTGLLAPIEMSTGNKPASQVKKQLQAGVDWLQDKLSDGVQPALLPIYCGLMSKSERINLNKPRSMVAFRGQKARPRLCDHQTTKLVDLLRKSDASA